MVTTLRAVLSVLMLVGFYLVASGVLVGLGWLSVLAFENGRGTIGIKIALVCLVAAVGVVLALWRVARARPGPEPGVVVPQSDAPELWGLVERLAAQAETSVPGEIRLVPEVNAAVSEDARWLGLVPGPRRLYLGVPLLMGLDVARLTSVLAHELGHYSRSHTRLAPITYRGQVAVLTTVEALTGNVVGWLLRQYAKLYLLVSAGVTRRQELEADELSVRIAGREVAQSALRELAVVDAAWSFYESRYLAPGWEVGVAPEPALFFSGFGELLAGRAEELAELRHEAPPAQQSRWDTHPSIAARIAAMERMPEWPAARDTRPATVLVPGIDAAAARLADAVVDFGDRRRLGWAELTATAAGESEQRMADVVYRAAARIAGERTATLGTVLDVVASGRGAELADLLGVQAEPPAHPLVEPLRAVIAAGLARTGVARWQHSWSGPAELVLVATGELLPVEELAAQAAGPDTLDQARGRLAELGLDAHSAGQVSERATAHGAEILGGLANVEVDGAQHDVVLLSLGLLLVACPKKKDGGKARIAELLNSADVVELAERHRFLAFEEVASATVHKRFPVRLDLFLHGGQTVAFKDSWSGEQLTDDSAATFVAIAEDLRGAPVAAG